MTGEAKINGAIGYLHDALEGSSEQLLCFAHHTAVLDAVCGCGRVCVCVCVCVWVWGWDM
jgi:hypothetical protein